MKNRIRRGAAALMALALLFSAGCKKAEPEDEGGPTIGYAFDGVTVVDEQESLSDQVQKMQEESDASSIALYFKNQLFSLDGINFDCFLSNPKDNPYDMYLQLFGDDAMTDELFLSGLIRPGTAFEHITLNHALNPGKHTGSCFFTLVDTAEDGTQTIMKQAALTVEFNVAID